jgi:hypothetical protein
LQGKVMVAILTGNEAAAVIAMAMVRKYQEYLL